MNENYSLSSVCRLHILIFLLTCMLSGATYGQSSYLAFRFGFNKTEINSPDTGSPRITDRNTYHFGLNYTWVANNSIWGISLETGYMRKGARIDHDTLDYKFHYLNFPILIDFYINQKIRLSAGPEISALLEANNHTIDGAKSTILYTYDNIWEVSGTVSASCEVTFFMETGIRYNKSFTDISRFDPALNRTNIRNSYFQLFILLRVLN